jgi:hypothetical protein
MSNEFENLMQFEIIFFLIFFYDFIILYFIKLKLILGLFLISFLSVYPDFMT